MKIKLWGQSAPSTTLAEKSKKEAKLEKRIVELENTANQLRESNKLLRTEMCRLGRVASEHKAEMSEATQRVKEAEALAQKRLQDLQEIGKAFDKVLPNREKVTPAEFPNSVMKAVFNTMAERHFPELSLQLPKGLVEMNVDTRTECVLPYRLGKRYATAESLNVLCAHGIKTHYERLRKTYESLLELGKLPAEFVAYSNTKNGILDLRKCCYSLMERLEDKYRFTYEDGTNVLGE